MIYYHFADKLALYRYIVCDMLDEAGARRGIARGLARSPPARKSSDSSLAFVALADTRPYFPPLMLREIAEGAPHLDPETLA